MCHLTLCIHDRDIQCIQKLWYCQYCKYLWLIHWKVCSFTLNATCLHITTLFINFFVSPYKTICFNWLRVTLMKSSSIVVTDIPFADVTSSSWWHPMIMMKSWINSTNTRLWHTVPGPGQYKLILAVREGGHPNRFIRDEGFGEDGH